MARVDLTVRGGGIFGLSVAWAACRRGARVRLIETARIGAGSSGGTVGALAPHVPEQWNEKKAFQLDSLLMASSWWAAVEAASGLPSGYGRLGRLQPLADADAVALAHTRAAQAEMLWRGAAHWRVVPAHGAAWVVASPTGLLVEDTLSARLNPRQALAALAAAVRATGGEVVEGRNQDDDGPVIWATGAAGLADLSRVLGRMVGGAVKGQSLSLRHLADDRPQLFVDGLHIVPHSDGTVAVGSTSETDWSGAGPDHQLDGLLARAVAACPELAGAAVTERWAGLRPRARSRAPMLGAWPGRPGHFVANGGFKIGFGMAPKMAEVMVDLVLDGRDAIPAGFRVEASLR
jgi:glycine oxidase